MNIKIIFFLFLSIAITPTFIFAHGNGHEEKHNATQPQKTPEVNDSIYAIDSKKTGSSSTENSLNPLFLSTNVLSDGDLLTNLELGNGEPMVRFEDKTDPKKNHSQHINQKNQVKNATHQWVSSDAKGHRVAIVITLISGLAFAALSFFRTGERNIKNSS